MAGTRTPSQTLLPLLILFGIFVVQSLAADVPPGNQLVAALNKQGENHIHNDDDDHEENTLAEAPAAALSRKLSKHHSSDKSVAGGGVIIGGLITAIFAAVYCYIRVTRPQSSSSPSPLSDAALDKH